MPSKYIRKTPAFRNAIFPIGPSIAYIDLAGRYALVDWDDAIWLQGEKWCAVKPRKSTSFYARTNSRPLLMHRRLISVPIGMDIDHKNRNGLDNRRCNLRPATRGQNNVNSGLPRNNTSGIRGVVWDKARGKWAARIKHNGEHINLGRFDTLAEASQARNEVGVRLYGEFYES